MNQNRLPTSCSAARLLWPTPATTAAGAWTRISLGRGTVELLAAMVSVEGASVRWSGKFSTSCMDDECDARPIIAADANLKYDPNQLGCVSLQPRPGRVDRSSTER